MPSLPCSIARTARACLVLLALASATGCGGGADGPAPAPPAAETVVSVSIAPAALTVEVGATAATPLVATVTGSRGSVLTGRAAVWSTSDPSRATVSNGVVTGVAPGEATISASVDGRAGVATVTVTAPSETVASVSVSPATVTLQAGVGATAALTARVTGSRGSTLTGRAASWSSSDPSRATVSSAGIVSAVSAGEVTITAMVDGVRGSATVTVTPPPVFTVTVAPAAATLPLGLATQLVATVRNETGAVSNGETVTWTSSDATIASIDPSGLLVTHRPGTVAVTALARGSRGEAMVTVGAALPVSACQLPNRTSAVGLGFPRAAHRLRATGTVRATVLFVDFIDAPATRSPQSVLDILQPSAPAYFAAMSYGAMEFILQPNLRWLRMAKPSAQYGWPNAVTFESHRAFLQEAADLAASTTDFSATDLLVVMTNPDAGGISNGPALVPGPGGGIRVAGRTTTIDNATNSGRDLLGWGGRWLNHEVGHLLSLPDLYDYGVTPQLQHLHVGEWSSMGLISGRGNELTAFERWQLGWIRNEQVVCAPTGTSLVSLSPVEVSGGYEAAIIPLGPTSAVVVEGRRALGYDAAIPQPGPLVYLVDTGIASGRGTMRVLPIDDADRVKLGRTLQTGGTISYQGATVTLVSRTDGADVVRVTRP